MQEDIEPAKPHIRAAEQVDRDTQAEISGEHLERKDVSQEDIEPAKPHIRAPEQVDKDTQAEIIEEHFRKKRRFPGRHRACKTSYQGA